MAKKRTYKVCKMKQIKTGDGIPQIGEKIGEYTSSTFPALNATIKVAGEQKVVCFVQIMDSGERIIVVK